MKFSDSLTYDRYGKLLAEYRRGSDGTLEHSILYLYDDSGRAIQAGKYSSEGRLLEKAECSYEGRRLVSWRREQDGIVMDGISFSEDSAGTRQTHVQEAMQRYSFTQDKAGRARKAVFLGGMANGPAASAEFGFDPKGKHISTRFFGAGGGHVGRDTILRAKSGDMRELRRYDGAGSQIATIRFDYGSLGQIARKSFLDQIGVETIRMDYAYLARDSLMRLNTSGSAYDGPTTTGSCELDWYRNLEVGIEMASFYGLQMPQGPARIEQRQILEMQAAEVARELRRESELAELDGIRSEARTCREKPDPQCLAKAERELDSLLRPDCASIYRYELIDTVAGLILAIGGDRAYRNLLARADIKDSTSNPESILLAKLLKARLERAYGHFYSSSHPVLALGPDTARIPGRLAVLPRAHQDAWRYRQRLLLSARSGMRADTGATTRWNYADLHRAILAFLRSDKPELLEPIRGFEWEGWCGTGSEVLYGPKSDAFLIAALERGDAWKALTATVDPYKLRNVLMVLGLDWEAFFLGAAADYGSESRGRSLEVLSRFGGVESARALLQLDPGGQGFGYDGYFEALGTFLIEPGQLIPAHPERYRWPGFPLKRDVKAPVLPADLRGLLAARLVQAVDANPYRIEAMLFIRIFSGLSLPERRRILLRLAALPDPESRDAGLSALRELGVAPGTLPPLEPVKLIFTSKGKPFPRAGFQAGYPCRATARGCSGELFGSSIDGGQYTMDRRSYEEAWDMAKALRLHSDPVGIGGDALDEPVYDTTLALEENPSGPILMEIPLRKVEWELKFPPGFVLPQERKMQVRLRPSGSDSARSYPFEVSARKRLAFSKLADGFYELELAIPGLQPWRSGRIQVKDDAVYTAELRKD